MSNRIVGPVAKKLIAAKARIENPENWWGGKEFTPGKRCALTALSLSGSLDGNFLYSSASALFGRGVIGVNDELGHAAVMKLYDHAIQLALSEGK